MRPCPLRLAAALVLTLFVPGVFAPASAFAPASQINEAAAYKALTGDDLAAKDQPPVAVLPWAGGPPGSLVVATLDADGETDDQLGAVRVGLLSRQGAGLTILASNVDADEPDLRRAITPSTPGLAVDPAIFRIAPGEVAVAVDVTESLITTSTSASTSTLLLYRRFGHRLIRIFSALTDDTVIDKTTAATGERSKRWIVRFTSRRTRGLYDLVVQAHGAQSGRTYAWNGVRYAPRNPGAGGLSP